MDNWKYALVASVVTVLGMALLALLSRFRLWKVSLSIFLVSSRGFCIIGVLGRRSNNHGFEGGDWGTRYMERVYELRDYFSKFRGRSIYNTTILFFYYLFRQ